MRLPILREPTRDELMAWVSEVCDIIQPARNGDEWGADVSEIIRMRQDRYQAAIDMVWNRLDENRTAQFTAEEVEILLQLASPARNR